MLYSRYKKCNSSKIAKQGICKNMLQSEKNEGLLPDWAFFIQAVLNINDLSLTASRDSFVIDSFYKTAKEIIAMEIKQHLNNLAVHDIDTFSKIVQSHTQSIKMLAVEDDTMLELFMQHLVFETNKGSKTLKWIHENSEAIYYTNSNDDFRQIKRIATAQEILVINACYSFESDILKKIAKNFKTYNILNINPFDLLKKIELSEAELQNEAYIHFISNANQYLEPYFCVANLSRFNPTDLPVLFVADEKSANQHKYQNQSKDTSNPFNAVIQNFHTNTQKPILCFNLNNELVRSVISSQKASTEAIVKLLYIQSLFLGQYPIQRNEMELMNFSLNQLLKN
jgi:molecular chaperone HtpG